MPTPTRRVAARLAVRLAVLLSPTRPFVDAAFDGGHHDGASTPTEPGAAVQAGARTDRIRWQRPDLIAALRADAGAPEQELTIWPPVSTGRGACQGC